jgi:hypothetical protein
MHYIYCNSQTTVIKLPIILKVQDFIENEDNRFKLKLYAPPAAMPICPIAHFATSTDVV